MERNTFTPESAQKMLTKAGVKFKGNVIEVKRGSLGIKLLGAVDYLVNHCNGKVNFIDSAAVTTS